jgi:hypothetical protein
MHPSGNEPSSVLVPDAPPLVTLARLGKELRVTVLHAAAADLLWQNRQQLVEIHRCTSLRLIMLSPARGNGATQELQWRRPVVRERQVSWRRR